jgi:hypothetical protein
VVVTARLEDRSQYLNAKRGPQEQDEGDNSDEGGERRLGSPSTT